MKISQELFDDIFNDEFIKHCSNVLNKQVNIPIISESVEYRYIYRTLNTIKKELGKKIVS